MLQYIREQFIKTSELTGSMSDLTVIGASPLLFV